MLITVWAAIDLDTILQVGVFLFIIISTLAGQFFSKNSQRPGKGQKPRPRSRPQRPKTRPGPETRPGQTPDRQPPEQPWNEPIEVRMPREPVRAEPVRPDVVAVEAISVEPEIVRESVAEHVQRHIERGGIDSFRPQSQVEQADERMASHLHDAFDHRLGRLEGQPDRFSDTTVGSRLLAERSQELPPVDESSDIAARVAQMMQTPVDLSAAIVLNEILKRPDDRWNESI